MSTAKKKSVYLIGSLANKEIPHIANEIRSWGFECFDDWWSVGPMADEYLLHHAKLKGLSYKETLQTYAATNTFDFDHKHLLRCDLAVMATPSGKSAHLELGYMRGLGKPAYVLFESEPTKVDIMYQFVSDLCFSREELHEKLKGEL